MGPRKRAKPNPTDQRPDVDIAAMPLSRIRSESLTASNSSPTKQATWPPTQTGPRDNSKGDSSGSSGSPSSQKPVKQVRKTRSFYGSWPRKATPSTQLALETIVAGTTKPSAAADFSRFGRRTTSETRSNDGSSAASTLLPKIPENGAATSERTPGTSAKARGPVEKSEAASRVASATTPAMEEPERAQASLGGQDKPGAAQDQHTSTQADTPSRTATEPPSQPPPSSSSGWFGWWMTSEASVASATPVVETAPRPPEPAQDEHTEPPQKNNASKTAGAESKSATQHIDEMATSGSWFGFWGKPVAPTKQPVSQTVHDLLVTPKHARQLEDDDVIMKDAPENHTPSPPPKAGSTWAFWSRDSGSKVMSVSRNHAKDDIGELAVMGENSESRPQRANSTDLDKSSAKDASPKPGRKDHGGTLGTSPVHKEPSLRGPRGRPQSVEIEESTTPRPSTPKSDAAVRREPLTKTTSKTLAQAKLASPNLLLPSFQSTYRMKDNPSILRQIAQLLLRTQSPEANHVFLAKDPPKIKKAIAIGVHGLFPAQFLRPMIGQPTGTSIRFANHCAESIRNWANSHGCGDCDIEKVALEGEGRIGDRVDNLWRLLLNWIDHIRRADLIMIACHSQGVPVGIILLAKLVELGIVTDAKIGVCAMAGVSLGPFPEYRTSMGILMGSASELWEFSNTESQVSRRLEHATRTVLRYGARITFIGSIDDQLVPLESAIYSPVHHPYIYRAAFIDGRIHAPDFIGHLVGFAMKIRNLGASDQGLIRELSIPLAGSLYGGEGHSRLYDDTQVYDLAVVHALETTDVGNVPCEIHKHDPLTTQNPYLLPWTMRGLLEQDFVKTELSAETAELLRQFDDWKPTNKALKDVKYRLEAVRSRL